MSDIAHPLSGLLEPGARPYTAEVSIAISLKRIADSMERIALADGAGVSDAICEGINRGAMDWIGHMARNGR